MHRSNCCDNFVYWCAYLAKSYRYRDMLKPSRCRLVVFCCIAFFDCPIKERLMKGLLLASLLIKNSRRTKLSSFRLLVKGTRLYWRRWQSAMGFAFYFWSVMGTAFWIGVAAVEFWIFLPYWQQLASLLFSSFVEFDKFLARDCIPLVIRPCRNEHK